MNFKDTIRTCLKETETTQQQLADKMGYSHGQANVSKILSRDNIYINSFVRIMNTLGYKVIVRRNDTEHELTNG